MSEHDHDNIVVQGNVGETMQAEEEEEEQGKKEEQEEGAEEGRQGESQQPDELQQKVEAREGEEGKIEGGGEEKLAAIDITGSELSARQQRQQGESKQRKKQSAKQKEEEQQPTLVNLSNELKKHTKHLSKIEAIVQPLPKYLKNADKQSKMIKELYTSIKQLQRYMGQIQKTMQVKKK